MGTIRNSLNTSFSEFGFEYSEPKFCCKLGLRFLLLSVKYPLRGHFDNNPYTLHSPLCSCFSWSTFIRVHINDEWFFFYCSFCHKNSPNNFIKITNSDLRQNTLTEIQKLENSNSDVMMENHDFVIAANRFRAFWVLFAKSLCGVLNFVIWNLLTYLNRINKAYIFSWTLQTLLPLNWM